MWTSWIPTAKLQFSTAFVKGMLKLHHNSSNWELTQNIVDLNGQTPLYYAIKAGRYEMVEFLIKKKVNLSNVDLRGKTPSHWAR